jgi:hypothetical protein
VSDSGRRRAKGLSLIRLEIFLIANLIPCKATKNPFECTAIGRKALIYIRFQVRLTRAAEPTFDAILG